MKKYIPNFILQKWYEYQYRDIDPTLCCCGEDMSAIQLRCFAQCRSAKEYAVTCSIELER